MAPVDPMMAKLDPNDAIRRSFGVGQAEPTALTIATRGVTIEREAWDGFVPQEASWMGNGLLPRSGYNYGRDVQQGFDSNVIMAPVFWIMRNFTEAQARVESRTKGVWEFVEDHPVEVLIDKPNGSYNGNALWKATCISYVLNGNAYWLKVRNIYGEVIELWYVPHWLIEPRWPADGSAFISHYEYRPSPVMGLKPRPIPTRDVVHFRFGLDPRNPRLGFSPLRPLLGEIFTDDEAASFSATILRKQGVPGLMVAPKNDAMRPSDDDVKKLKTYMAGAFTGGNRGETLVMKIPTEITQFGFDPGKLLLGDLRDVTEERVCAILGLPAAVVGFGSGLSSTKVGATMRELRKLAWVQCLNPMQTDLAGHLTDQLLPDFVVQTRRFNVAFDTSRVAAFQEEKELETQRIARLVQAGMLRVDRGQEMSGLEVDPNMRIYYQPSNSIRLDEFGKPLDKPATSTPQPPAPDPATTPAAGDPADEGDAAGKQQWIAARLQLSDGNHKNGSEG